MNVVKDNKDIFVEQRNALEVLVRGDTPSHVAMNVCEILSKTHIAMERYDAYVPSLEDIFMEVTADE